MIDGFTTRLATVDDAALITHQRIEMFIEIGKVTPEIIKAHGPAFKEWVIPALASGEYIGFLACDGDIVAAGAGVLFMDTIPGPGRINGVKQPYILNVYTETAYRRKGLAKSLVQWILEYCKEQGYKNAQLHASDAGRPIYESIGFKATNQMDISL